MGVKHLVAIFRLGGFFQREVAVLRRDFYLLELIRLGHGEPDIQRFARISYANGERVIQLKVARPALGERAYSGQQEKRDSRNSAQRHSQEHGFLPFGSVWKCDS